MWDSLFLKPLDFGFFLILFSVFLHFRELCPPLSSIWELNLSIVYRFDYSPCSFSISSSIIWLRRHSFIRLMNFVVYCGSALPAIFLESQKTFLFSKHFFRGGGGRVGFWSCKMSFFSTSDQKRWSVVNSWIIISNLVYIRILVLVALEENTKVKFGNTNLLLINNVVSGQGVLG